MTEIDVCVPVAGKPDDVLRCLDAVVANTQTIPFRMILGNDGQGGAMTDALRGWAVANSKIKVTLFTNQRRAYFVRTCNLAASHGHSKAIAFLHPSVEICDRQWAEKVLTILRLDSRARCVTTEPEAAWNQLPPYSVTSKSRLMKRGLTVFRRIKGFSTYWPETDPHDSLADVQRAVFTQGEHFWVAPNVRLRVMETAPEPMAVSMQTSLETKLNMVR